MLSHLFTCSVIPASGNVLVYASKRLGKIRKTSSRLCFLSVNCLQNRCCLAPHSQAGLPWRPQGVQPIAPVTLRDPPSPPAPFKMSSMTQQRNPGSEIRDEAKEKKTNKPQECFLFLEEFPFHIFHSSARQSRKPSARGQP